MSKEPAERIQALADKVRALLAGQGPEMQGAVLAELVSTYILGFFSTGGQEATDKVHEKMLELHVEAVRLLISVNTLITEGRERGSRPH